MDLKQYFSCIIKRIWIILLLPVIAAVTSAYVSFYIIRPVYESNTTLYVINNKTDPKIPIAYNDILVSQQLVKDYREIAKSRTVTEAVINELNLRDITVEDLAKNISVNPRNDTRLIEIKVRDKDPERARVIASKLSDIFIQNAIKLMKVENVSVVDKAQKPDKPIEPLPLINIIVSIFAGVLVAVGVVFVIENFDNTIKTSEDIEKYLELTVLGTIPEFDIT